MHELLKIAIRFALCAAVTWLMWQKFGIFAVVFCAPLFGVALARPLIDLFASTHGTSKAIALRHVQGRYFQHRGHGIDIAEDDESHRWLSVADARKAITGLPRDEVLQHQFGERVGRLEPADMLRIRADALVESLLKSRDPDGVKFKVWLEREVIHPSGHGAA
jgi:hypothetical protein